MADSNSSTRVSLGAQPDSMCACNALVVAAEEGEEVLRQVVLVAVGQRPDDAEIEGDVAAVRGNEDVARMHVGMKEAVAEDLREKDLDPGCREFRQADTIGAEPVDLRNRRPLHPLHDHDGPRAVVPVHLGHDQQRRVGEVAAQLRGVGGLTHQIQLVAQILGELGDHLARLQATCIRPKSVEQDGKGVEQCDVVIDDRKHVRAQDLDRDFVTAILFLQPGEVNLGDRGRSDRYRVELGKHVARRTVIRLLDFRQRQMRIKWRHAILQFGKFVGNVGRQQVAAGRQHLAELDENRPQRLQRHAQPCRPRGREVAPELQRIGEADKATARLVLEHHFVQPEAAGDGGDLEQAEEAHGRRKTRTGRKTLNDHVNTQVENWPARHGFSAIPANRIFRSSGGDFLGASAS